MKKIIRFSSFLCLVLTVFLLTGCRQDPESMKKKIASSINAASLYELTMKNQLEATAHIPGMSQTLAAQYEDFCKKYSLPLEEPFEKLLKKGFPGLVTTVQHEVLAQGENPFEKDEVLYLVTYKVDAKNDKGVSYVAVLQFTVYSSPEGVMVMKAGGFDEINGAKTILRTPESVMLRVAGISRGVDAMLDHVAQQLNKKVKE